MTQRCRSCGCSNLSACPGGCWWVEDDLCSSCAAGVDVATGRHLPADELPTSADLVRVRMADLLDSLPDDVIIETFES
jgi:hypothetical protein